MVRKLGAQLPISVLIQTKNEEVAIEGCLRSLTDFDEIIVVDSNSSDKTVQIAKSLGVDAINFTWDGNYPKKKQWQLQNLKTKHDWILFLDADEAPTSQLIEDLNELFAGVDRVGPKVVAFDINLEYVFAGKSLKFGHRVVKRCLVRRDQVRFPEVDDLDIPGMGELEGHYQPIAHGVVDSIKGRIRHCDPDPIRTWFDRHNRYSDWEAMLRVRPSTSKSVEDLRSRQGRIFGAIPLKPLVFFLYSYLLRMGFLDGRAGFDYALALSMYYWQIGLKIREAQRLKTEVDV